MPSITGSPAKHQLSAVLQYKYTPLGTLERSGEKVTTRLLTIHAAATEDPICLGLSQCNIDEHDHPTYEALSYVWGSQDESATVYVGSERAILEVTQNLEAALRHLRLRDQPRTIWIDAICINQSDIAERSMQVAYMGDIYRRATRVVVWLGPEAHNSTHALDLLDTLSSKVNVDWNKYTMTASETATEGDLHWADKFKPLPYNKSDLEALESLFRREWFERLWIRQEIVLARDAIVQCGNHIITWLALRSAVYAIVKKDMSVPMDRDLEAWIVGMRDRLRLLFQVCTTKSTNLNDLRYHFSMARCHDPRDRIYGVLSMLGENDKALGIVPDYSQTMREVYRGVVVKYIEAKKDLNIMLQCEATEPFATPTWVPDWSVNTGSRPPLAWLTAAGAESIAYSEPRGDMLRVAGTVIDRIQKVTDVDRNRLSTVLSVMQVLQQIIPIDAAERSYTSNSGVANELEAYVRTLLRDYFSDILGEIAHTTHTLKEAVEVTKHILAASLERLKELSRTSLVANFVAGFAAQSLGNYSFYTTENGYVGLGRAGYVKPGDKVSGLLGCEMLMVLRECDSSKAHIVIGESYVAGFMYGEAFLGPLPRQVRLSWVSHETPSGPKHSKMWRMTDTGKSHDVDPRLGRLPAEFPAAGGESGQDGERSAHTTLLHALQQSGVAIEWFELA